MTRNEVLSIANLRNDGRKATELRRAKIQMGLLSSSVGTTASGSCLFQMGLTTVLACIYGPNDCVRRDEQLQDRAKITVHCRAAAYASSDRREINPNSDRKLLEESHLIETVMEASVLRHLYPKAKIHVEIYVLSDDGGRLSTAINATACAMVDAGIAMKDLVCSCSVGLAEGALREAVTVVDLSKEELMSSSSDETGVHLLVAMMPQRGTVVLSQCKSRLSLDTYEKVLGAAVDGCQELFDIMSDAVREKAALLLASRTGKCLISTGEGDSALLLEDTT
jgi:exosome complex component RRP41